MFEYIDTRIDALTKECVEVLEKQGFKRYAVKDVVSIVYLITFIKLQE